MHDIENTRVLIWTGLLFALVIGCGRKEVPEQTRTDARSKPSITSVPRESTIQLATTQREEISEESGGIRWVFRGDRWVAVRSEANKRELADLIAADKKRTALNPNDSRAYFCMGSNYAALGNLSDAIAAYKKCVATKHYSSLKGDAYCGMGRAYIELKQYKEAIAAGKKACAIDSDDPHAYLLIGVAYRKLKKYPEAISAYKKAITVDPTGSCADFARKRISDLSATQPVDK